VNLTAWYRGLVGVGGSWAAAVTEGGKWRKLAYVYISSLLD